MNDPGHPDAPQLFTVFGGTGFLGRRVVQHLLDRGHRVRIAARHPRRIAELLQSPRAEPFEADILKPATLTEALAGADGAVNAVSLYVEKGGISFQDVHVDGAAKIARLAAQAGVPRLLHVSGIGSDPHARDSYIRARGEGEISTRSNHDGTILIRPSVMFGPDDAFLSTLLNMIRYSPVQPLFGRGEMQLQPVHVEDVAEAIMRILDHPAPAPCYELAGPQVLTYRELIHTVGRAAGLRVRTVPLPLAAWRGLASLAKRLPNAPLTPHQVALMERDNIASGDLPGLDQLGVDPTSISDCIKQNVGSDTNS